MNNWEYFNEKFGAPIGAGAQCQVYRKGNTVYKVLSEGHDLASVLHEGYALAVAENHGIPVSKVHGVYTEGGHIVMEMDYVNGEPVTNKIIEAVNENDIEKGANYIKKLAAILAQLHKEQIVELGDVRKCYTMYLKIHSDISETLRNNLLHLIETLPDGEALCHNDYHALNVIVEGDDYTVIDWDSAMIGDAAGDVAHSYLATLPMGEPAANVFLDEYLSLTGMKRERVEAWMPFHAFLLYDTLKASMPEYAGQLKTFFAHLL